MKKDILITGAGGFIGSRIKGTRAYKRIGGGSLFRQTQGISGIVHLAAVSSQQACEDNPEECLKANLLFLIQVLKVALLRKIWVIFISTYQVRTPGLYGLSKLMGEEICRIYQVKGLRVGILRLPIVYGPGDKAHKVVTKFIEAIKAGKTPKIDTRRKFYFAYVDDVVEMIEAEVDVMNCAFGKKYSLRELVVGIRKCLNEKKK